MIYAKRPCFSKFVHGDVKPENFLFGQAGIAS